LQPSRDVVHWTLIIDPAGRPGSDNMSIDTALLRLAQEGDAFLRLYRWDPPCLSFGRNEPATSRYHVDRINALGLATVRRPTGGRAVWHDAELTYAVAAPCDAFGSLRDTYVAIHEMLVAALEGMGVAATLASRRSGRAPRPSAGACFALPVGGEIVVGGRKLVGSAQVRTGNAFLQHGSLLLDNTQDVVSHITKGTAPQVLATSLGEVLERSVGFDEVAAAVGRAARDRWSGTWSDSIRSPAIDGEDKFGDVSWTWRR
jgi:lipoate-protein ligase A